MKTKEEIEILRADAVSGDAWAQNSLGCAYYSGDGVAKNIKEAFNWFERSAKQNNPFAQFNLAKYYHHGWGAEINIQLAIEWYKKCAELNHEAANILGSIYENGYMPKTPSNDSKRDTSEIVLANPAEAFYWYIRGGNTDEQSRYNVARCHEQGIGTPLSLFKACKIYSECRGEDARKRLEKIRETYNPLLDTRLCNIDIIGNNPYRILGLYSNASEKDIRANHSKLEVMAKVGKATTMETDHIIPCTIADYITCYNNKLAHSENMIQTSSDFMKSLYESQVKVDREILSNWEDAEKSSPHWSVLPKRTTEDISSAIQKLASDKERIKYALFWFCKLTAADEKALKLLSNQEWEEASAIWKNEKNVSALINIALLQWIEGKDLAAIGNILKVIHDDSMRSEFISAVTFGRIEMSSEELSHIFWDVLYEFPEAELQVQDVYFYGTGKGSRIIKNTVTDEEKEYNLNKAFSTLKAPLDNLLRSARNQDENDFEKSRDAYEKVRKEAPIILFNIKQMIGEKNFRYKLLCNEVAEKLLEFAIHYNNDKKGDWSAAKTALYFATSAKTIAIDDNLRERCEQNVEIFKRNKQISSIDQLLEAIGKIFKEVDEKSVTLEQAEKIQKDVEMFLYALKTENGNESDLYKNVSDNAVNAILNVIVAICNRDKDATTAISASGILKKLKCMDMSSETRSRLERNSSIISNNMVAAMRRGNLGDLGNSGKTYSKEENKSRRIHKALATVCSIAAFALMWYYMSWNNNLQYFMERMPLWGYICIIFMVFIALFPIIMWGLEFQKDPHNTRLYWLDNSVESLYNLSNDIMRAGVQGRKTYSWPFAIPFQLLGIAIWILSFPIRGMAKLAAMIK